VDEEIEIEISAQGKVTVRTKGIKGPRCLDVAELFARIVGREESRQLTSEYYETDQQVLSGVEVHRRQSW
jgi:DUF2997 family protein